MISLFRTLIFSTYALSCLARFTSTFPSSTTTIDGNTEVTFKWEYTRENLTFDPFASTKALCDLMWGDQGYRVALLAQNVNPDDNELKVFIRADYGFNSSQYYIRYRSKDQKGMAYSDRFTLSKMNGPDFSLNTTSHGAGNVQISQSSSPAHLATHASATYPTPSVSRVIAAGGPSQTSSSPSFIVPTESPSADALSNKSGAMSLTRQQDSAWKKFSLLLWPLMVGAIMAM